MSTLPPPPSSRSDKSITWKSLAITFAFGGGLLLGMKILQERKGGKTKSMGKAALGGLFSLVDHNNKSTKSEDFLGQWLLIYFGFTHCPDICPDELEKRRLMRLVKQIKTLPDITPILITVDPDRDTPEALAAYVKGEQGSFFSLYTYRMLAYYRVYYSQGPKDEDNDYNVDHTIIMYLVGPDGQFLEYFGQNKKSSEISSSIASHMTKYKNGK
uniref:SCO cytochrome c oxidase assembly protein 1 n=1 Tax=Sinocyclocheilus anshuiensis TaxID=1608454 RepID=A0A671MZZ3_9TELE